MHLKAEPAAPEIASPWIFEDSELGNKPSFLQGGPLLFVKGIIAPITPINGLING